MIRISSFDPELSMHYAFYTSFSHQSSYRAPAALGLDT